MNLGLDMLSLLVGTGSGLVKLLLCHYNERQQMLLKLQFKDIENARRVKNKFYQWTRRIISIMLVGSLVFYPIISAMFHWPINIPYWKSNGGLLSLFVGKATLQWITFTRGLTFVPVMIPAIMYIMGFYFGSGGTNR